MKKKFQAGDLIFLRNTSDLENWIHSSIIPGYYFIIDGPDMEDFYELDRVCYRGNCEFLLGSLLSKFATVI
jgi:hypothetical protein